MTNNRITSLGSLTDKNQSRDSLTEINLSDNNLKGLVGISKLSSLRTLDVSRNQLIDLEGVSELKSLISLRATNENQLGFVESYEDLNRNKSYDLGEPFNDLSRNGKRESDPLIELNSLPFLYDLQLRQSLTNIISLKKLSTVKILLLSGNQLYNIDGIESLQTVSKLSLDDNLLSDISSIGMLRNLTYLSLAENRICDIRGLNNLVKLKELQFNLITYKS